METDAEKVFKRLHAVAETLSKPAYIFKYGKDNVERVEQYEVQ